MSDEVKEPEAFAKWAIDHPEEYSDYLVAKAAGNKAPATPPAAGPTTQPGRTAAPQTTTSTAKAPRAAKEGEQTAAQLQALGGQPVAGAPGYYAVPTPQGVILYKVFDGYYSTGGISSADKNVVGPMAVAQLKGSGAAPPSSTGAPAATGTTTSQYTARPFSAPAEGRVGQLFNSRVGLPTFPDTLDRRYLRPQGAYVDLRTGTQRPTSSGAAPSLANLTLDISEDYNPKQPFYGPGNLAQGIEMPYEYPSGTGEAVLTPTGMYTAEIRPDQIAAGEGTTGLLVSAGNVPGASGTGILGAHGYGPSGDPAADAAQAASIYQQQEQMLAEGNTPAAVQEALYAQPTGDVAYNVWGSPEQANPYDGSFSQFVPGGFAKGGGVKVRDQMNSFMGNIPMGGNPFAMPDMPQRPDMGQRPQYDRGERMRALMSRMFASLPPEYAGMGTDWQSRINEIMSRVPMGRLGGGMPPPQPRPLPNPFPVNPNPGSRYQVPMGANPSPFASRFMHMATGGTVNAYVPGMDLKKLPGAYTPGMDLQSAGPTPYEPGMDLGALPGSYEPGMDLQKAGPMPYEPGMDLGNLPGSYQPGEVDLQTLLPLNPPAPTTTQPSGFTPKPTFGGGTSSGGATQPPPGSSVPAPQPVPLPNPVPVPPPTTPGYTPTNPDVNLPNPGNSVDVGLPNPGHTFDSGSLGMRSALAQWDARMADDAYKFRMAGASPTIIQRGMTDPAGPELPAGSYYRDFDFGGYLSNLEEQLATEPDQLKRQQILETIKQAMAFESSMAPEGFSNFRRLEDLRALQERLALEPNPLQRQLILEQIANVKAEMGGGAMPGYSDFEAMGDLSSLKRALAQLPPTRDPAVISQEINQVQQQYYALDPDDPARVGLGTRLDSLAEEYARAQERQRIINRINALQSSVPVGGASSGAGNNVQGQSGAPPTGGGSQWGGGGNSTGLGSGWGGNASVTQGQDGQPQMTTPEPIMGVGQYSGTPYFEMGEEGPEFFGFNDDGGLWIKPISERNSELRSRLGLGIMRSALSGSRYAA